MMRRSVLRLALFSTIAAMPAGAAWADLEKMVTPPLKTPDISVVDSNHVDLASGQVSAPGPQISIGSADSGLMESQSGTNAPGAGSYAGGVTSGINYLCDSFYDHCAFEIPTPYSPHVFYPGGRQSFYYDNGQYVSATGTGDVLTLSGMIYTLTMKDGTRYTFDRNLRSDRGDVVAPAAILTKIERPNGEVIKISISQGDIALSYDEGLGYGEGITIAVIDNVISSAGWRLQSDNTIDDYRPDPYSSPQSYPMNRKRPTVAFNMSVYNCFTVKCDVSLIPFPRFYIEKAWDMTNETNGHTVYHGANTQQWITDVSIYRAYNLYHEIPGGSPIYYAFKSTSEFGTREEWHEYIPPVFEVPDEERWWYRSESRLGGSGFSYFNDSAEYTFGVSEGPNCIYGIQSMDYGDHRRIGTCVTQVERGGQQWNYSYEQVLAGYKVTTTNPDSTTREVVTWQADTLSGVYSSKDELGRITSYEYGPTWRMIKQTLPGGQYTTYAYDSRGNLTEVKDFVYGSTTAWRTQLASYPASCTSTNFRICNKPDWVQDANGNRTYYVYDPAHGGVTIETGPADTNGVRPQTRYTYSAKYAQVKNSGGSLVNIGTLFTDLAAPIYKLTKISTCTSSTIVDPTTNPNALASCINPATATADAAFEQVKELEYNHPNLLLTSETVRNGTSTVSATTSYAYDSIGNVTKVDGPRTDVDDTSYTTYDVLRRKEYEIGPDPDGGSSLPRPIAKHYYDSYGNETRTETGTGSVSFNSTTGVATVSGFTWATAKKMTYGDLGMLQKTEVVVP